MLTFVFHDYCVVKKVVTLLHCRTHIKSLLDEFSATITTFIASIKHPKSNSMFIYVHLTLSLFSIIHKNDVNYLNRLSATFTKKEKLVLLYIYIYIYDGYHATLTTRLDTWNSGVSPCKTLKFMLIKWLKFAQS